MIIKWQNLINLPVETESGNSLGHVSGVDVDIESHSIKNYRVKSKGIIKGLLNDELLISPAQVISIDRDKMVVYDSAVSEKSLRAKKMIRVAQGAPKVSSSLERSNN